MASKSKTLPLWTSLFAAAWWFWSKSTRSLRLACVLWKGGSSLWCNTTREKEPLPHIWKCFWGMSLSSAKCLPSVYSDSIWNIKTWSQYCGVSPSSKTQTTNKWDKLCLDQKAILSFPCPWEQLETTVSIKLLHSRLFFPNSTFYLFVEIFIYLCRVLLFAFKWFYPSWITAYAKWSYNWFVLGRTAYAPIKFLYRNFLVIITCKI